jgi:signal transduction histidine kinase
LRLPPLTRDLEIDYTALSLSVPEKVRFRYRLAKGLKGANGDWQDAGARREAFYTNLSPGNYRFSVMACNNDGVWNPAGATLAFAILPAFHQTLGFFGLCAVALAGLAWSAYRWRVRQVRASLHRRFEERLDERTRIARDLHDTLLQGFMSASMQLYAAVEELPPEEPARSHFDRVQELMRHVIEEGRGALRGLRSPEGSVDDLETSLSRVPSELGIPVDTAFRVVAEGRSRPLLPVVRDEIYSIAREALVNAFRHAGAARIEVEIEYAARQLRVVVRDNGRGIDADVLRAGRKDHWGLSGMRERAERIGARLQVWSRAGSGTEVELAVPNAVAFTDGAPSSWWARWLPSRAGLK